MLKSYSLDFRWEPRYTKSWTCSRLNPEADVMIGASRPEDMNFVLSSLRYSPTAAADFSKLSRNSWACTTVSDISDKSSAYPVSEILTSGYLLLSLLRKVNPTSLPARVSLIT